MKNVEINYLFSVEDGLLSIYYKGKIPKHIDENIIIKNMDTYLSNNNINKSNLKDFIIYLNQIIKDWNNNTLDVSFQNTRECVNVRYNNNQVSSCSTEKIADNINGGTDCLKVQCLLGGKLHFNVSSNIPYESHNNIIEEISNEKEYLVNLINSNCFSLGKDGETLCQIYKIFYKEDPNFKDIEIDRKIQDMMSILYQFGISLGDKYYFDIDPMSYIPSSLDLHRLINSLKPLGNINDMSNFCELDKDLISKIEIISNYINDSLKGKGNYLESLDEISIIMYAGGYKLSNNSNVKDISKFTNLNDYKINKSISLVKTINNSSRRSSI